MASLEPQARLCCGLLTGGGEGDLRGCAVIVALQPVAGHGARWRGLLLAGASPRCGRSQLACLLRDSCVK